MENYRVELGGQSPYFPKVLKVFKVFKVLKVFKEDSLISLNSFNCQLSIVHFQFCSFSTPNSLRTRWREKIRNRLKFIAKSLQNIHKKFLSLPA